MPLVNLYQNLEYSNFYFSFKSTYSYNIYAFSVPFAHKYNAFSTPLAINTMRQMRQCDNLLKAILHLEIALNLISITLFCHVFYLVLKHFQLQQMILTYMKYYHLLHCYSHLNYLSFESIKRKR